MFVNEYIKKKWISISGLLLVYDGEMMVPKVGTNLQTFEP